MNLIEKLLKKIITHDKNFIDAHQNPVEMTRKMNRIAKRYNALRNIAIKHNLFF